jgi:hypothetical protein
MSFQYIVFYLEIGFFQTGHFCEKERRENAKNRFGSSSDLTFHREKYYRYKETVPKEFKTSNKMNSVA